MVNTKMMSSITTISTRLMKVNIKLLRRCRKNYYHSSTSLNNETEMQFTPELLAYSNKKQSVVSLKTLMETGIGDRLRIFDPSISSNNQKAALRDEDKIKLQVAGFLHRELPVRLAHRAVKLEAAPLFRKTAHIRNVCNWYKQSFEELRFCEAPSDLEKENKFAKVIESIFERHSATLITMAKGAHQIRSMLKQDISSFAEQTDIQSRLDEFYMSRIAIRMLIGQYLALRKPDPDAKEKIGLISLKASPYEIALETINDAAYMCTRTHGDAPEVQIFGRKDLTFPYVSSHISYIMLELLKNSMRATVEKHGIDNMPPIRIVISDGEDNEDVVIKVSDEGGGIKRSNMNKIWSYLYTTADPSVLERMLEGDEIKDFDTASPLAGLGYGLPIARNYARYFGGELTVMSMEGYGTDSFIYLPRLKFGIYT